MQEKAGECVFRKELVQQGCGGAISADRHVMLRMRHKAAITFLCLPSPLSLLLSPYLTTLPEALAAPNRIVPESNLQSVFDF